MKTTYSIAISDTTESQEEMATLLRRIADLIEEGYTAGYQPYWTMNQQESK